MTYLPSVLVLMLAIGVTSPVPVPSVQAAIEESTSHAKWYDDFVQALKKAAENGPARHSGGERVKRHVQDIEYHVSSMLEAAQANDRTKAREEGERVVTLLDRAKEKGYFTAQDVEGLLQHLQKYLPVADVRRPTS